jgi:hypothetical protein
VLQNLLRVSPPSAVYDSATQAKVMSFQRSQGLPVDGDAGPVTLAAVLRVLSADNYRWNGTVPGGALFLIHVPVSSNRSMVHNATLYDSKGNVRYTFLTRACGQSWTGGLLNQFSTDGATPTGLMYADLNSPEDDPYSYGPYPIVRCVTGAAGNAGWLLPNLRNGILLHTGEWPLENGWPPCSHGCIHTVMPSMKKIVQILTEQLSVRVHNNTGGKIPYPYKTQGYVAVEVV